MCRGDQGKQHAWEPVGHNTLTDWKKYSGNFEFELLWIIPEFTFSVWKECIKCVFLGAASTSDDEPPLSDEDEEFPANRDQPHLRFEITSDDGFSVEADSIEGKANNE